MPAVVIVTEVFANLAASAARARGFQALRRVVLPHPMETRSREEIVALARKHFPEIETHLCGPA